MLLAFLLVLAAGARPAAASGLELLSAYDLPVNDASNIHAPTLGAYGVTLSADGLHLYATAEYDSSIDLFARDAATRALEFVEPLPTLKFTPGENNTFGPRGLALSPDGLHLYVAGHNDGILGIWSRDAVTGKLTFVAHKADTPGTGNGLAGAEAVVVS